MRTRCSIILIAAVVVLAACSTPAPSPSPLPDSSKGYELYSWQEGGQWRFTLITGTNRNKTHEEIVGPEDVETADGWVKITVVGEENLLRVLARLPRGEDVFWSSWLAPAFAMPPADTVSRIQAECRRLGLVLAVG